MPDPTSRPQDHLRAEVQAAIKQAFSAYDDAAQSFSHSDALAELVRALIEKEIALWFAAYDKVLPAKVTSILNDPAAVLIVPAAGGKR